MSGAFSMEYIAPSTFGIEILNRNRTGNLQIMKLTKIGTIVAAMAIALTHSPVVEASQIEETVVEKVTRVLSESALASWYRHGHTTANGEKFNPLGLTAAHKTLRFGTMLKVTNLANGKSVVVRINDRGPFIAGREIDLSLGAAREIGMENSGVARVKIEYIE